MSKFETYKGKDGFRWRFRATNGNILADSSQGYSAKADRDNGIALCRKGDLKYEITESKGQFYWKAKSANGNTIADGSEGYKAKASCQSGMESFQKQAPDAPVVEAD
jgi:uncharacterized protein